MDDTVSPASSVYLQLGDGLEIVKSKPKTKKTPNYYRVGNGTVNKNKIESIDLLREMANMSKPAQFLVLAIKDGMSWVNGFSTCCEDYTVRVVRYSSEVFEERV
jgi:hypothetical protein